MISNPNSKKQPDPEEKRVMDASQRLRNFCSSYNLMEADEMLARLFTVLMGGNYSTQSNRSKERLLDYFEALEEVLPAIYELKERMDPANKNHV